MKKSFALCACSLRCWLGRDSKDKISANDGGMSR